MKINDFFEEQALRVEKCVQGLFSLSDALAKTLKGSSAEKIVIEELNRGELQTIRLNKLQFAEELNIRVPSNPAILTNWAALMVNGTKFPPIRVYHGSSISKTLIVVDGVLRVRSGQVAGIQEMEALVHVCDPAMAFLMRYYLNAAHAVPLSTREKKPAVMEMLRHPDAGSFKDRGIGRIFGIDHKTVGTWKRSLTVPAGVCIGGQTAQNATSADVIGKTAGSPGQSVSGSGRSVVVTTTSGTREPDWLDELLAHPEFLAAEASWKPSEEDLKPSVVGSEHALLEAGSEVADAPQIYTVAGKTETMTLSDFPKMAAEAQKIFDVKPGDRFRIRSLTGRGYHYLVCGDATVASTYEGLIENPRGALLITDPPFSGVIPGPGRDYTAAPVIVANQLNASQLTALLTAVFANVRACLVPGAYYYVFESFTYRTVFSAVAAAVLGREHQPFHWVKVSYVKPLHAVFGYGTESGIFGWVRRPGARLARLIPGQSTCFPGEMYENSIYDVGSAFHPCSKPVMLPMRFIEMHSRPENLVIDPFLGSGSTALAAELTGRRCFGIEIVPALLAVALWRFQRNGNIIERMGPGDTFDIPESLTLAEMYEAGIDPDDDGEYMSINDDDDIDE